MSVGKNDITIRSSAAEYLTFITATGRSDVNAVYAHENVWLTQKMMGVLYDVDVSTINYHLKKLFRDGEIDEDSTIGIFPIVATNGKTYRAQHYNFYQNDFDQFILEVAVEPGPDGLLEGDAGGQSEGGKGGEA